MTTTLTRPSANQMLALGLTTLLTFGLLFANLHGVETRSASTHMLSNTVAAATVGTSIGGCGILVGAVGAVVGLGLAGVTVGIGAALAISATIHVGAILCATK